MLYAYRARKDPDFAAVLRDGSREQRFTYMYESHKWDASGESPSGAGSSKVATATLRAQLADLLLELDVQSVFDAGCGDFNWMKDVLFEGTYIGADIVPPMIEELNAEYGSPRRRFRTIDLPVDKPEQVDLIFCREVLFHLPTKDVQSAFRRFKESGSRWLLVTTDTATRKNWDIEAGGHRPLNLERAPFDFPEAQRYLIDDARARDRRMALYRTADLPV